MLTLARRVGEHPMATRSSVVGNENGEKALYCYIYSLQSKTEVRGANKFQSLQEKIDKTMWNRFFEVRAFQRYAVCLVWTMSH